MQPPFTCTELQCSHHGWQPDGLRVACRKPENIKTSGMLQARDGLPKACFLDSYVILEVGSRLSLPFVRANCHMPLADQVAGLFLEQGLGSPRMRSSRAPPLLCLLWYRSFDLLFRFLPGPGGFGSRLRKLFAASASPDKTWKQIIAKISVFKQVLKINNMHCQGTSWDLQTDI